MSLLAPDSYFDRFKIVCLLGEGGMAEVYKAWDPKHSRFVALKLPKVHPEQNHRIRFQIESHALAALNHPNICTLYECGHDYLVMEYIDGAPIRGPLDTKNILTLGVQMAGALEEAHRGGFTHRDLNPKNILVTKTGLVKVLDFGLAKRIPLPNIQTTVERVTQPGTLIGTVDYMSPEQAGGGSSGSPSDIFSLGVILYELSTGAHPFRKATVPETLHAIRESPLPAFPESMHSALSAVIRQCLQKRPEARQTSRDLRIQLQLLDQTGPATITPTKPSKVESWLSTRHTVIAASFGAFAAVLGVYSFWRPQHAPPPPPAIRAILASPHAARREMSISPNGEFIVFLATGDNWRRKLLIRNTSEMATKEIAKTEGARGPFFWSSDSRQIVFSIGDELKVLQVGAETITTLLKTESYAGGAWHGDKILILDDSGVSRIDRLTGAKKVIVPRKNRILVGLQMLPDGIRFLYGVKTHPQDPAEYFVALIEDGQQLKRFPVDGCYVPSHISPHRAYAVRLHQGALTAHIIDGDRLTATGDFIKIADKVQSFSASNRGQIIYREIRPSRELKWIDRSGNTLQNGWRIPNDQWESARLSPNEQLIVTSKLLFGHADGCTSKEYADLWILRVPDRQVERLTSNGGLDCCPVWTPDNRSVIFRRGGDLYQTSNLRLQRESLLYSDDSSKYPTSISADGTTLIVEFVTSRDIGQWFTILSPPVQKSP